jgi:tRNA threonylcarbamoyladenosine biosynthesis protein TsaB
MRFLLIDTCTERGVIAYGNQHNLLFEKNLTFGLNQSKFLLPDLVEALKPFGHPPSLDAIGVGIGPGSYTGIRIGVAVAQTLAYSWNIPLVGVCSLEGFVPSKSSIHYAALIDARIGGVYFQEGWSGQEGIHDHKNPQVLTLQEIGSHLEGIKHLVTPYSKSLQGKIKEHCPECEFAWEERAPSVQTLLYRIEQNFMIGNFVKPPAHLDLLYLRQTEAEREKIKRAQQDLTL